MIAVLILSMVTGFLFAGVSIGIGSDFWTIAIWYVAGLWVGFLTSVATILLLRIHQQPHAKRTEQV